MVTPDPLADHRGATATVERVAVRSELFDGGASVYAPAPAEFHPEYREAEHLWDAADRAEWQHHAEASSCR